jgi:hypothetical protein
MLKVSLYLNIPRIFKQINIQSGVNFKSIMFCTTTGYFLPFFFPIKQKGKKKRRMK